ncbi:MAG: chloride channel protein [Niabella sp.]
MAKISKVRAYLKKKFDLLPSEKFKLNLLNALPFWVGAFITGCVAVLYTKLFSWTEEGARFIFSLPGWVAFIVSPITFVLGCWLVIRFAPYARGSGIPQVTASIQLSTPKTYWLVSKFLSLRIILIKILSSIVITLGGGIIGREGPTIQIAASVYKKIYDILPAWYPRISKRNMIVTGGAAGLAAAFNTPLGGIVFAIEELTKTHLSYFRSALLTGVIIAGLTALGILGPYLYLGYPELNGIPYWITFVVIPAACFTGLFGTFFQKSILYILKKQRKVLRTKSRKLLYAALAGLVIAAIGTLISVDSIGTGKHLIITTLFTDQKDTAWYMPITRFIGNVATFTSGGSGGIFAPSLSLGASIGGVISNLLNLAPTQVNLIVLCCMAGFLTSVTGSPFTSSILILEMTNSQSVIFYIMLASLCGYLVTIGLNRHSFYDNLKNDYLHEVEAQKPAIH